MTFSGKRLGSNADKATVWCYFGGLGRIWLLHSERRLVEVACFVTTISLAPGDARPGESETIDSSISRHERQGW